MQPNSRRHRMNLSAIQRALGDPATRPEVAKRHNVREEDIPDFKIPGYNIPELKKSLNDTLDAGFKRIYDAWKKLTQQPQTTILTHNNDQDDGGRHIAPYNVNISSVIALNLVCDAIEGSYQINLEQSN